MRCECQWRTQPINNTHISTATLQQIPTENTLDVASPARLCYLPQIIVPMVIAPKRCIRAPCRRSNQQEEGGGGEIGLATFSLPLYQNRKEKEDEATVHVSALPIPAARQSGEPA